jgi:deoxyadenosine/deoxycytidine kinase
MSPMPAFLGISGQIAAGKSTLVRGLAAQLALRPLLEREAENPYLERYYRDPRSWAFHNALFFFEQSLTDNVAAKHEPVGAIQERLPQEHIAIFAQEFHARGFLSDDDIALFERLANATSPLWSVPDLLIYLDIDPMTALHRLQQRARGAESEVSLDYLEALNARYERFIDSWTACPVLRVDSRELDVRQPTGVAQVASLVVDALPSRVRRRLQNRLAVSAS